MFQKQPINSKKYLLIPPSFDNICLKYLHAIKFRVPSFFQATAKNFTTTLRNFNDC